MMDSILKPCMLYVAETWRWTAETLTTVLTTERKFYRWCLKIQAPYGTRGAKHSLFGRLGRLAERDGA